MNIVTVSYHHHDDRSPYKFKTELTDHLEILQRVVEEEECLTVPYPTLLASTWQDTEGVTVLVDDADKHWPLTVWHHLDWDGKLNFGYGIGEGLDRVSRDSIRFIEIEPFEIDEGKYQALMELSKPTLAKKVLELEALQ